MNSWKSSRSALLAKASLFVFNSLLDSAAISVHVSATPALGATCATFRYQHHNENVYVGSHLLSDCLLAGELTQNLLDQRVCSLFCAIHRRHLNMYAMVYIRKEGGWRSNIRIWQYRGREHRCSVNEEIACSAPACASIIGISHFGNRRIQIKSAQIYMVKCREPQTDASLKLHHHEHE